MEMHFDTNRTITDSVPSELHLGHWITKIKLCMLNFTRCIIATRVKQNKQTNKPTKDNPTSIHVAHGTHSKAWDDSETLPGGRLADFGEDGVGVVEEVVVLPPHGFL